MEREYGAFKQKLIKLDLSPIAYKLMHPEEGRGWTIWQTKRAIAHYLMFLSLIYLYPNSPLVPTEEIDRVWHQHILDTSKYAEDCQMLFGQFIHHFPYYGLRSQLDRQNWQQAFTQTGQLFEKHFGADMAVANATKAGLKQGKGREARACTLPKGKNYQKRPSVAIGIEEVLS